MVFSSKLKPICKTQKFLIPNSQLLTPQKMKILLPIGFVMVALGFAGIFIPLLPTTPFLLAAVWCFARSDPKHKEWLLKNRYLGGYIDGYLNGTGLSIRQISRTLCLLWITLAASAFLFTTILWVRLILLVIGICVTAHIISRRKRKKFGNNKEE